MNAFSLFPLLSKRAFRSSIWQKTLIINIILGFFLLILLLELLLAGIFLDKIIIDVVPNELPEIIVSRYILYYFLFTFFLRYYIQPLPSIDTGSLLHLPLKRKTITQFIHIRSLTSFFNFLPFFVFLPFTLIYLSAEFPFYKAILWFLSILLLEWASNFLLIFIKRKSNNNFLTFLIFVMSLMSIYLVDYYEIIKITTVSEIFFIKLLDNPLFIVVPIGLVIASNFISKRYINQNLYLEYIPSKTEKSESLSQSFAGLETYGKVGILILNEIRLLLRNKRSKSILFLMPLFLLYGFFFYPQPMYLESEGWLVFVGIFVTGGFLMAYGQYTLAWESRHFDFLQVSNMNRYDFFRAKYYLISLITVFSYIVTTPYFLFGREVLMFNTMAAIYNIGINAPLVLFFSSFNRKRMDLDKGGMNYQGVGINNFIAIIPLMLIPALGLKTISYFTDTNTALIIFTAFGTLGIIFHPFLIRLCVRFFEERRYKISEGFRIQ